MAEANLIYHLDTVYREAFPDLASKVLGKLDGARDLGLSKLDTALGNGFKVPTRPEQGPAPQLDFKGIDTVAIVQGDERSYLGTPIFQPVRFLKDSYQLLGTGAKQGQVVLGKYDDWRLPASTTAEFKRAKAIQLSRPNAAFGSTKELWAFDDWDITLRGLILHPRPNVFPEEELKELLRWELVVDSIGVAGPMFGLLGIKRLVIKDLTLGKVAAFPNMIPFQMQCLSDEPLEISIQTNRF